ncbi:MAG: peptidylprolyl isomerase, partial [Ignavibacteriae bacterium]|nr:peptidylprolyl isomerase [Ignavibacteriota bacterium]
SGGREQAATSTLEEREKFLDLLTKFKLKLTDAYQQGLDKKPEIRKEIEQYQGSLVASFLTDREVTTPGVMDLFTLRKEEIRASHILLHLPAGESATESAAVYSKAHELIAALKAGAPFESLAVANSTDPSVSQNKGDLYYFTGGQMVPEFERAAYAMKVGEISSQPVRSQFGLHIIKIVDRKPAPRETHCAHIMIRFPSQNPSPEDTLDAFDKIKTIQDSLAMGIDFADLAKRNSQDPGSAPRGGDLGIFGRRRWIQSFDEVAHTLDSGQVSGIVRTIYGYHLIKCYEKFPPKSFEDGKKEVQQLYQQTRFQEDYKKFLAGLKQKLQFRMNDSVATAFIGALDSTKSTRDTAWAGTIPSEWEAAALYVFGTRVVSVDSVVGLINGRPDMNNVSLRAASVKSTLDKIEEQLIFQVRGETMERDYPEFASIMKEYLDGILLYQIEQDRVWNRVAITDSALTAYFESHRDKFMYPDRVDFSAVSIANDSLAQFIHAWMKDGKAMEEIASEDSARMKAPTSHEAKFAVGSSKLSSDVTKVLTTIAGELKKDAALRVQLVAHPDTSSRKKQKEKLATQRLDVLKAHLAKKLGIAEGGISTASRPIAKGLSADESKSLASRIDVEILDRRPWLSGVEHNVLPVTHDERTQHADSLAEGAISSPFRFKNGFTIVRLNKRDPLRHKTFEEAGTEVSSAFQEYESKRLEQEWLDSLRVHYPVVEYKEVLKKAFAPIQ